MCDIKIPDTGVFEEIPNDPVGTGILILGYIIILTSWIGYSYLSMQVLIEKDFSAS